MATRDDRYRYSVAWLDSLARGRRLGRAVITRGEHADPGELGPRERADPLRFGPAGGPPVPALVPGGLLNRASVAAFNELWFRRAPRREEGRIQTIGAFFHPLDGIRDWNRLYGPGGLVQYQVVVPLGQEDALRRLVTRLSAARAPSFLTVLKRFGPGAGLLSFPIAGWTLALDLPARLPGLAAVLDELDDLVAAAGGRVYLAKDARLRPELLAVMYPELDRWRAIQRRADPEGRMCSDLARRLGLLESAA
jgi:decaprenylphospho-beta-D-ribofuranose 2-oxidase